MKLAELARALDAELVGDGNTEITGVAGIEEAGPGHVTFVANKRYAALAGTTQASAVLVTPDFPDITAATLRTKNPYLAFARAIAAFHRAPAFATGIHPTAVIDPTARVGRGAHVGAYVVVGAHAVIGDNAVLLPHVVVYSDVKIGNNFLAHSHVTIREGCEIGNNVVLQNGVIIGSDGFGFAKDDKGHWHKILQPGPVIIGDDVEIQAHSCVDRASVGNTRIERGVKIDSFVQVGHGCTVDEDALLCGQVALAGSSHIGKRVILAGQVGIAGHLKVGDDSILTAQSGISHDVEPGKILSGSPAFDNRQWLRAVTIFNRLPELMRQVQRLSRAARLDNDEK